ncbi:MAG: ABC transporter permease [Flavobacteriales bacterium]|nr:ABC transporter permease [Flavobacteriales bacterium]
MHKIWLITKREFLSRVKKKSFIVMTLLGPILIGLFYAIIIGLAINQKTGEKVKKIAVVDKSGLFNGKLNNPSKVEYEFYLEEASKSPDEIFAWLIIPEDFTLDNPKQIVFKSTESITLDLQGRVANSIEASGKNMLLMQKGIRQSFLDSLSMKVNIKTLEIDASGALKSSRAEVNFGLGVIFAFIIYFFIFLYGVQVMRGVMEEKTNRIVEIIVSSVKPFQLMMGKILGIAMVGLTQFLIWVVFTIGITSIVSVFMVGGSTGELQEIANQSQQNAGVSPIMEAILSLNLGFYLVIFVFYFLFGYLLYSSMFAAIGSAVDSESDTQQFMLPVTIPLILSFATSFSILGSDPNGGLASFMSIFPLTSPIIMMVRLPFNPPVWELIASMVVLIATFLVFTWLAGRIYRVGILMTGKKPTYRELFKWMLMK